jgi:hypothetical protein
MENLKQTKKTNNCDLPKLREGIELYSSIKFLEDMLKHYDLLDKDSNKFQDKLLNFNHLDLDMPEGNYSDRVTAWLDFLATVCVTFEVEPLVLTEGAGVPNIRHLLKVIQGLEPEQCPHCKGKAKVVSQIDYQFYPCKPCFGLGFMLPEVEISYL